MADEDTPVQESFFSCTLTKGNKEFLWNPNEESEEDVECKLTIDAAVLGHKAKEGERNVVEVTTQDDDGTETTCPIVSLRVGGQECFRLKLGFMNPAKFVLKEGSGPLALNGNQLKAFPDTSFSSGESEESEDEEVPTLVPAVVAKENKKVPNKKVPVKEEQQKKEVQKLETKVEEKKPEKKAEKIVEKKVEDKNVAKKDATPTKRPLAVDKNEEQPAKKKKEEPVTVESDEDMEDGSDEDDDSEEEEMPSLLDGEAVESSDEEDSEEGDEPEGDDLDSEDDDDEEEDEDDDDDSDDEESDEEEETPVKKQGNKKVINGHGPKTVTPGKEAQQKGHIKQKTPAAAEQKTPAGKKTPGKKDNTPRTPAAAAKKTPEEIKTLLLKSPNLPKKFDKFANYMKNNLKVVDQAQQKEFWNYLQKNKK